MGQRPVWSTLDRQFYLNEMTAALARYLKDDGKEPAA